MEGDIEHNQQTQPGEATAGTGQPRLSIFSALGAWLLLSETTVQTNTRPPSPAGAPGAAEGPPGCPHRGGWRGRPLTHILLMSLSSFLYLTESFRTWRNDNDNKQAAQAAGGAPGQGVPYLEPATGVRNGRS